MMEEMGITVENINTSSYKHLISNVLIDDREVARKDFAIDQYFELNPVITHLTTGDYIFVGDNGTSVCFEYKTGADFINSINNSNHLHNQTYHMITEYKYHFVIIETEDLSKDLDKLRFSADVHVSMVQINGAISDLTRVTTVLFAQSRFQAFDLMMRVAGKIIQDKPFCYKYELKSENTALNYLQSIRGLNNKAFNIVSELQLKTLTDLLNLSTSDLTKVDGIGKKTAERIITEIRG